MRPRSSPGMRDLLAKHRALVASDNAWQKRARLAQSLWRQAQGLEAGLHAGRPLGSRLTETDGFRPRLRNYVSAGAREAVERAVATKQRGAVMQEPRLWVDLLSSQPMCFNLFGELSLDLKLAGRVLGRLWPDDVATVESIVFEWSPGREDLRYTGNKSAFDVFVAYQGPRGPGFLAIEAKYHENLRDDPAAHHERYDDLARWHGMFVRPVPADVKKAPLQQLWLDHLLALQTLRVDDGRWREGRFVVLYPAGNLACASAVGRYRELLAPSDSFGAVTLERFIETLADIADMPWIRGLRDRYLADEALHAAGWPTGLGSA